MTTYQLPKLSQVDGRVQNLTRTNQDIIHNHHTQADRQDNLIHIERQAILLNKAHNNETSRHLGLHCG